MKSSPFLRVLAYTCATFLSIAAARADVIINEIMYHPAHAVETVEPFGEEFIELFNNGTAAVSTAGWSFSGGVSFVFPSVVIAPGDGMVIAADPAIFATKYPAVTGAVLGPWTGRLSNSGERLRIIDAGGAVVDEVSYSDDGDWAVRRRGPLDLGHRGWVWETLADGGGRSLELMNAALTNKQGQNWAVSVTAGGSPGGPNSVATTNIPPMVREVKHSPAVPSSSDFVRIRARLTDESVNGLSAQVYYRVSSLAPGPFAVEPMYDDGLHDDGEAGDFEFAAQLPAHADGSVVEFYVSATDSTKTRTWPGPTDGAGTQGANALYLVEDSPLTSRTAVYRIVMSEAENDEFAHGNFDTDSDAQMNATFIATRGVDNDIRYNIGLRRRGASSRNDNPRTMRANIPGDRDWDGNTAMNLNANYTYLQVFGQKLFAAACMAAQQARQVKMVINGQDESAAGSGDLNYGFYSHMEPQGSESVARQFPDDPKGNLYRKRRPSTDLAYRNGDVQAYLDDGWAKQSNESDWDWSDLDAWLAAINDTGNPNYLANLSAVIDIDQWLRHFAIMALINNGETNISTGTDDDYYTYRGVVDPRFKLIPHDLDTILGFGDIDANPDPQHTLFDMIEDGSTLPVLVPLMTHPEIVPLYYAQFRELLNTSFSKAQFDALADQCLQKVPSARRQAIKSFMDQRRAYVLSIVDPPLTVTSGLPLVGGFPQTTSGTVDLGGNVRVANVASVLVNGSQADIDATAGTWSIGASSQVQIVAAGSVWRYLDDGSDQGTAWRASGFTDSGWAQGAAQLGYGDGDEATVVGFGGDPNNKYITTYFRHQFNVTDPAQFTALQVLLKRDDGAAVYLNGTEIVRDELAAAAGYQDVALSASGAPAEDTFFPFSASASLLVSGTNTLAVEVHQRAADNADISFDLELRGLVPNPGAVLNPGVNRVVVRALDSGGNELERQLIDVWYDDGDTQSISGTLASDTTLTAAAGPYLVAADLTVPSGVTLTIEPGTSVFFASGTRLTVNGKLVAAGTATEGIWLSRTPDTSDTWDGTYFSNTLEDNVMAYIVQSFSTAASHSTEVADSRLLLDHVAWEGTTETVLEVSGPQLDILNCNFPSSSGSEAIHGTSLSGSDYFNLIGNVFRTSSGYNDIIDFSGGRRPGPIIYVIGNLFNGGTDDCLDLDGIDAHIEGNIFRNIHTDDPGRSSTSNAIATDGDAHLTVVRNVFDNVDHALLLKNDADAIFENNVVRGATLGAINFREPLRPTVDAGSDVKVRGNIFVDNAVTFRFPDHLDSAGNPPVITADNNIMPAAEHFYGTGNLDADPSFVDADGGDYSLRPGSAAIGSGINGANMGADIPYGAQISGTPPAVTASDSATLTVHMPGISGIESGSFVTEYMWRINGGPVSAATDISVPISLSGLADGTYTVEAVAKDSAGNWQSLADPAAVTWSVDSMHTSLVLNEVLADSLGASADFIELYNAGASAVNVGGLGLSDDPALPLKYTIPAATSIAPGEYLIVFADSDTVSPGLHSGFGLDADGEAVYLSSSDGQTVLDSVAFGMQVPDCSIGRTGSAGAWELNTPTPNGANVRKGTGDPRGLSINEWLATSQVVFCDDFIELYNPSSSPVSLSGLYLSDDPGARKAQYEIPALSYIAAGGFGVLLADGSSAGANHLPFRLDGNVEWIGLYAADLGQIDLVAFDSQVEDISQGRQLDGGPVITTFTLPTAGLSNDQTGTPTVTTTNLVALDHVWAYEQSDTDLGIAWRAAGYDSTAWPTGGGLLYVEGSALPGPKTTPLTLGAQTYYFRTTFAFSGTPGAAVLKLSTVIDDGYVLYLNGQELHRLRIDNPYDHSSDATGSAVGNASLEGEFVVPSTFLIDGTNVLAAEVHQNGGGSSDVVFGISLDAEVTTPGTPNPAYAAALKTFAGLRITELMFHPSDSEATEFVELQNVSAEAIELGGVRFTDGIDFVFPAMSLAPGAYVLIVSDALAFEAKYGAGLPVAGQYTGKLSNGGEQLVLQLPVPYDANIQKFTYNDSWYPLSDGVGYSMEIIDTAARVATWDQQSAWRIGALQGTPGSGISLSAGSLQITDIETPVTLGGSAIGAWTPTFAWTQVGGVGIASFGDATSLSSTASFSEPGTYLLRLTGTDSQFSLQSDVVVVVNDLYASWAALSGVTGGMLDDDDCDGIPNLVEYAFGMNPLVYDAGVFPGSTLMAGQLVIEFGHLTRKTDVTVGIESSGDLSIWTPETATFVSGTQDQST